MTIARLPPAKELAGYGSAEMLAWPVHERGIEPHIPVFDKSARKDGTFSRDDFTYDHQGDAYTCPGGKLLTARGTLVNDGATLMYRASKFDCAACAPSRAYRPRQLPSIGTSVPSSIPSTKGNRK